MLTIEDLLKIRLLPDGTYYKYPLPTPEDVLGWFNLLQAGWVHDGDVTKPHAKLHSEKCSTGFFMCKKVLAYGNLREILAACIINELKNAGLGKVDGVFGSPYSSILLAGDVARLLGVKVYVPEKYPSADPKEKRMLLRLTIQFRPARYFCKSKSW